MPIPFEYANIGCSKARYYETRQYFNSDLTNGKSMTWNCYIALQRFDDKNLDLWKVVRL